MSVLIQFPCDVVVGQPTDRALIIVGTSGTLFVEGPDGLTATLGEADVRLLAEAILARVSAPRKTPVHPLKPADPLISGEWPAHMTIEDAKQHLLDVVEKGWPEGRPVWDARDREAVKLVLARLEQLDSVQP